jgi:hypothetical protein
MVAVELVKDQRYMFLISTSHVSSQHVGAVSAMERCTKDVRIGTMGMGMGMGMGKSER